MRNVPKKACWASVILAPALLFVLAFSQSLVAQPVALNADQLDQLVARIALYPDPLLAQILTASTYSDQIPEAAAWADQHQYLHGQDLSKAISDDHLTWDPSILALLPFSSVLDMMSSDMAWTRQLGDAVLSQRPQVMDAVQRMRKKAHDYGYLQTNGYMRVLEYPGYIEILPVDPASIYVPIYDPFVVFSRPVGHVVVSAAITFGTPVYLGSAFVAFGWAHAGFNWPSHVVLIAGRPWERTWVTRAAYVHHYSWVRPVGPRIEVHDLAARHPRR